MLVLSLQRVSVHLLYFPFLYLSSSLLYSLGHEDFLQPSCETNTCMCTHTYQTKTNMYTQHMYTCNAHTCIHKCTHTHVYMHMIPYCMPLSTLCFGLNYPIFYTCYHYMWLIILYRRQYNRGQETLLFAVSIFLLSLSSVAKYMTMFSSTIVKIITYVFEAFVLL